MSRALRNIIRSSIGDGRMNTEELYATLLAREENIADHLRLAANQFGLMSPIVDEVIVQAGLGKEPSAEDRKFIADRFNDLMAELRRQQGENN